MVTSHDHARALFPGALTRAELLARVQRRLDLAGVAPQRTLLALCVCPDEVNVPWHSFAAGVLPGPFLLGGLAGLPAVGATGFNAFTHHLPDDGAALIVYGPHVGLGAAGEVGLVQRFGRQRETACCGALSGTLDRARQRAQAGVTPPALDPATDHQAAELERLMQPQMPASLSAPVPLLEATRRLCDVIRAQIEALLRQTAAAFGQTRVFLVGGVFVNTGPGEDDLFAVRDETTLAPGA